MVTVLVMAICWLGEIVPVMEIMSPEAAATRAASSSVALLAVWVVCPEAEQKAEPKASTQNHGQDREAGGDEIYFVNRRRI